MDALALRQVLGLGQAASQAASSTLGSNLAEGGIQALMVLGGGAATVVGIGGAIASDQYRKQFAVAGGLGVLLGMAGAWWAVSTMFDAVGSQLAANAPAPSQPPALPAAPSQAFPPALSPSPAMEGT